MVVCVNSYYLQHLYNHLKSIPNDAISFSRFYSVPKKLKIFGTSKFEITPITKMFAIKIS